MPPNSLLSALNPASIAVVGASQNPDKIGGRPIDYLQRFGYQGQIYPINALRSEVQGIKAYETLQALPAAPDMAIIAVPREDAIAAVNTCAEMGTRMCVVMTAGFGEGHSTQGRTHEREMVAKARSAGMRIVGPNCQGLANFSNGVLATFSTMVKECPPQDGHVAILSQSGTLGMAPYGVLRRRGIGICHAHSTGNDADVTIAELAAAVAEDEQVRLMLLYLEGIPDPENIARLGRIAQQRDLPVLALKSGRTAAGQVAALSHTGAIASEDRVVDAFLERHGIWRVQTMEDLVDAAEMYLKRWRINGRRLVTISASGAAGVLATDAAIACGMQMATFEAATRERLGNILPSFANVSNPVDITGAILNNRDLFDQAFDIIARDPAADAFLAAFPVAGAGYDVESYARAAARVSAQTNKPVVAASPQPDVAAVFLAHGIPTYTSESRAVAMLDQLTAQHGRIAQARARASAASMTGHARPGGKPRSLNEADSLAFLAARDIPVVRHHLCATEDGAVEAWRLMKAPVVVKGCSSGVTHKSELGLVRLGIEGEEQMREAFRGLRDTLEANGAPFDGVIVAERRQGLRELLIGAHRDPVFGPVVVMGDGGKYVEVMPDNVLLLAPFTHDEARERLQKLRIAPLFNGVRGDPPMDIEAYIDVAMAVGRMMVNEPQVVSVDLNPVLVDVRSRRCCALDAVVVVDAERSEHGQSR